MPKNIETHRDPEREARKKEISSLFTDTKSALSEDLKIIRGAKDAVADMSDDTRRRLAALAKKRGEQEA
jgi:hypothetical protein